MAETDAETMRAIRETLESFTGQPMFLAGSYVFLRTSESFLFDRRAGGYQCRGFRSELIVTAHCSWKIVRDGERWSFAVPSCGAALSAGTA